MHRWHEWIILFGCMAILASCQGGPASSESVETVPPQATNQWVNPASDRMNHRVEGRMEQGAADGTTHPIADRNGTPADSGTEVAGATPGTYRAVYFVAADGGEIDRADLIRHPEIKAVHRFPDLKEAAGKGVAVWIDRGVADQVDRDWLKALPQRTEPVVLVGYHDTLYAFRETLDAFDIEGPRVDWSERRVAPGFSVWLWTEYTASTKSAWHRGYDQAATVQGILAATTPLLKGELPPTEAGSFDHNQAVAAVLAYRMEYPQAGETRDIEIMTGGPAPGILVKGTLATEVETIGEPNTYLVTLTKRWNLIFNDEELVGHWRYKVTPEHIQLIESKDNTELVRMVR